MKKELKLLLGLTLLNSSYIKSMNYAQRLTPEQQAKIDDELSDSELEPEVKQKKENPVLFEKIKIINEFRHKCLIVRLPKELCKLIIDYVPVNTNYFLKISPAPSGAQNFELKDGFLACFLYPSDDPKITVVDTKIKIYNKISGKCIKILEFNESIICNLIEIGDGLLASIQGDRTIKIWNIFTGKCVKTYTRKDYPNFDSYLSGLRDSSSQILKLENGSLLQISLSNYAIKYYYQKEVDELFNSLNTIKQNQNEKSYSHISLRNIRNLLFLQFIHTKKTLF